MTRFPAIAKPTPLLPVRSGVTHGPELKFKIIVSYLRGAADGFCKLGVRVPVHDSLVPFHRCRPTCPGEPNPVEMNVSPLPGETGQPLLCRIREIVEVPFGVALDRLQIWICIGSFLTGYK